MGQFFLAIAAIFGGLSVGVGAFGAHALKEKLTERSLEIFETGAKYQMYHALALLLVGLLIKISDGQFSQPVLIAAGWNFMIGILLFSGSLYALSLTGIKVIGAITPLGGAAFIAGWGALTIAALNNK
ncbi:MAG: hypothetical protein N4J56_002640 [Chroococcidiopsis sp. SAG 2025]|uniref:DUF423 domain-containing protein n=1 Tax=Chroococcidiopsis sp. SAG 2025 TaxID=171389 RepID=UPI002936EA07|nr:DUF423 domain-containing protein [Chroococcidiopsis sp. SAG 2025]MDV2992986.1 hypothetical protein [Chroococcidiopsis sp. SAG 2025]